MTDRDRLAIAALLRVIAENGPAFNPEHPEDHGVTAKERDAIAAGVTLSECPPERHGRRPTSDFPDREGQWAQREELKRAWAIVDSQSEQIEALEKELAALRLAASPVPLDVLLDVRHEEDDSWSVSIRALPGHVGCAMTLEEAYAEAHDAALAWVDAASPVPLDVERRVPTMADVERVRIGLRDDIAAMLHYRGRVLHPRSHSKASGGPCDECIESAEQATEFIPKDYPAATPVPLDVERLTEASERLIRDWDQHPDAIDANELSARLWLIEKEARRGR